MQPQEPVPSLTPVPAIDTSTAPPSGEQVSSAPDETPIVPLRVPELASLAIPPLPSAPPPPVPLPSGPPALHASAVATESILLQLRSMGFQELHEHFRQEISAKLNDPLWGIPKDKVRDALKLNTETPASSSALPIQTGEEDNKALPAPTLPAPPLPRNVEPETDEERRRQAEQWNKVRRLFVPPMSTMGGWMLWRNIQDNQYFVLQEHKVQYGYRILVKSNNFAVVQATDLPSIMVAWSFLESIRGRCEDAGVFQEGLRTVKFFIMVFEMARQAVDEFAKAIDPLLLAMQLDLPLLI